MINLSRNKYPEETRNLIIDVSMKLFLDRGYEHTTIQNIIDNLGGLSKGAIYHHFSSKEDILRAVSDKVFQDQVLSKKWEEIKNNKTIDGKEKLKQMLYYTTIDPEETSFRQLGVNLQKTPHLLSELVIRSVKRIAPESYLPVIEEGVKDGSIKTLYPKELSEALVLIINVWLNPVVFHESKETMENKFLFMSSIAESLGIDEVYKDLHPAFIKMIKSLK